MKKYIFCEAWRSFKSYKKHQLSVPFSECLSRTYRIALSLKKAGFDFKTAWCNK